MRDLQLRGLALVVAPVRLRLVGLRLVRRGGCRSGEKARGQSAERGEDQEMRTKLNQSNRNCIGIALAVTDAAEIPEYRVGGHGAPVLSC